ncbi:prepilin-type N-terminal cleavage/methylation domain-containing protein [Terrimicrobium sacchariphilum]|uniref:Prepilin-type N-terminal cleavage/methylation domain-containing protein n=1 Tax=Terrimicrobium sacchariphilum TaxID=690879 RepID=A0A146GAX3_TERSA|nr:type II secretion system protein [Terrimicrobium sacchariphilum]GAT34393.1 prepilin-type N-terminal cleavage/methylation domain-containing protein [Terrimicrobium sacchariphilum]
MSLPRQSTFGFLKANPVRGQIIAPTACRAFTLMEILVTVAIIGILATLLFPTVSRIKDNANLTKCSSNLRQWGIAYQLYMADHDGLLPQQERVLSDPNTHWQNLIAPYVMGGTKTYLSIDLRTKFRCPNDKTTGIVYGCSYYLSPPNYAQAPAKLINLNKKLSDFILMAENYTGEFWNTERRLEGAENPDTSPAEAVLRNVSSCCARRTPGGARRRVAAGQ